jgi:hypothetical protein
VRFVFILVADRGGRNGTPPEEIEWGVVRRDKEIQEGPGRNDKATWATHRLGPEVFSDCPFLTKVVDIPLALIKPSDRCPQSEAVTDSHAHLHPGSENQLAN